MFLTLYQQLLHIPKNMTFNEKVNSQLSNFSLEIIILKY